MVGISIETKTVLVHFDFFELFNSTVVNILILALQEQQLLVLYQNSISIMISTLSASCKTRCKIIDTFVVLTQLTLQLLSSN